MCELFSKVSPNWPVTTASFLSFNFSPPVTNTDQITSITTLCTEEYIIYLWNTQHFFSMLFLNMQNGSGMTLSSSLYKHIFFANSIVTSFSFVYFLIRLTDIKFPHAFTGGCCTTFNITKIIDQVPQCCQKIRITSLGSLQADFH